MPTAEDPRSTGSQPAWAGAIPNVIILLVAAAIFTAGALVFSSVEFDDPYITFRYARHLAQGHGPLWNLGEKPVEGYTSTAWMLWSAAAERVHFPPLLVAKVTGYIAGLTTLGLAIFATRRLVGGWVERAVLALLFAVSADLSLYAVSGMEHVLTVPLVLFLLVALDRAMADRGLLRPAWIAAALVGALCWVRPESQLVLIIVALAAFGPGLFNRASRKQALAFVVGCAVVVAPLQLTRFWYFGSLLPNTYYAKHSGGRLSWDLVGGVVYLGGWLREHAVFIAIPALAWTARRRTESDPVRLVSLLLIGGWLAYAVKVGGDDTSAFPGNRLMLPLLPVVLVAAIRGVGDLALNRTRGRLALATLLALFVTLQIPRYWDAAKIFGAWNNMSTPSPSEFLRVARTNLRAWANPSASSGAAFLSAHTPPGEAIAIPWAGRISYETDLPVIDLLGLNDAHIASLPKRQRGVDVKYDAAYVLARRPYFICENFALRDATMDQIGQMSEPDLYRIGAWKIGQRELLASGAFHDSYAVVPGYPGPGVCFRRQGP